MFIRNDLMIDSSLRFGTTAFLTKVDPSSLRSLGMTIHRLCAGHTVRSGGRYIAPLCAMGLQCLTGMTLKDLVQEDDNH